MLSFELLSSSAAGSGFAFTAGIGIVTADAFATGTAAMPSPFDDILWPGWMWLHTIDIRSSIAGAVVGDPSINPVHVDIDVKAMRKLRNNETLFMSVQSGETGTATANVRGMTRVLVKLP